MKLSMVCPNDCPFFNNEICDVEKKLTTAVAMSFEKATGTWLEKISLRRDIEDAYFRYNVSKKYVQIMVSCQYLKTKSVKEVSEAVSTAIEKHRLKKIEENDKEIDDDKCLGDCNDYHMIDCEECQCPLLCCEKCQLHKGVIR